MTKRKVRSITVIGKRWFDKVNGNTYFSAQILVNGEPVHNSGMAYGYGDMYLQSSSDWLDAEGIVKLKKHVESCAREPLWQYCERMGIALHSSASDVGRKKDL